MTGPQYKAIREQLDLNQGELASRLIQPWQKNMYEFAISGHPIRIFKGRRLHLKIENQK
jgi:hypothetical protein